MRRSRRLLPSSRAILIELDHLLLRKVWSKSQMKGIVYLTQSILFECWNRDVKTFLGQRGHLYKSEDSNLWGHWGSQPGLQLKKKGNSSGHLNASTNGLTSGYRRVSPAFALSLINNWPNRHNELSIWTSVCISCMRLFELVMLFSARSTPSSIARICSRDQPSRRIGSRYFVAA